MLPFSFKAFIEPNFLYYHFFFFISLMSLPQRGKLILKILFCMLGIPNSCATFVPSFWDP